MVLLFLKVLLLGIEKVQEPCFMPISKCSRAYPGPICPPPPPRLVHFYFLRIWLRSAGPENAQGSFEKIYNWPVTSQDMCPTWCVPYMAGEPW